MQKGRCSSGLFCSSILCSLLFSSVLFFELFFFARAEARRWAQRFAVVVERQAGHVLRVHAARGLCLEHDEHGTAGQTFAERETATAGKTRVHESLQHDGLIIRQRHMRARISFSKTAFGAMPMCLRHTLPSLLMMNDAGMPQIGP